MELNEYQKRAMTTCMPTCDNFAYMMLNLVGEVGELASKVAKMVRRDEAYIHDNHFQFYPCCPDAEEYLEGMKGELGDILWQLSGLCHTFDFSLEEVARYNLEKLASRRRRGVIDGNGDNR